MFCFYCGKQNPDDSKFCLYCGKNIDCKESDSNEINSGETKSSKKNNDFNYKPLLYSEVFAWKTIKTLLKLEGRVSRRTACIYLIIFTVFRMFCGALLTNNSLWSSELPVLFILNMFFFYMIYLSIFTQRLHDMNFSGWYCLFGWIIIFLICYNLSISNGFSLSPKKLTIIGDAIERGFIVLVYIMPGAKNSNKYGNHAI